MSNSWHFGKCPRFFLGDYRDYGDIPFRPYNPRVIDKNEWSKYGRIVKNVFSF